MKKLLLTVILFLLPAASFAAEEIGVPKWSFEVKGGLFVPDLPDYRYYYGDRSMAEYGISWSYKIMRQLEAGVEGLYARDKGLGYAIEHGELNPNAEVTYETLPLNFFVLLRGKFAEGQVVVPYVAGGWTRLFYRQQIKAQEDVKGSVDGLHARAGIQLLLDDFDPEAANSMYHDYGIYHTYFFIEGGYSRAMIDGTDPKTGASVGQVNLGGNSIRAGLLFEY